MNVSDGKNPLVVFYLCVTALSGCTGTSDFETTVKSERVAKRSVAESPGANDAKDSEGEGTIQQKSSAPEGVATAIAQCQSKSLLVKSMRLDFPETKGRCNWDIGEQEGGSMMGYMEQKLKLPVESSWVVCSMAVRSTKEELYYDDYISLQFNGRVLLGTTGIVDMLEKDEFGLPIYDWSRLQRKLPQGSNTCLSGATKCSLPGTQQNGALQLEFDAETNQKLMSHALSMGQYEFQIVATGDNDPAIDCAHNGIPLDVSIEYYVK